MKCISLILFLLLSAAIAFAGEAPVYQPYGFQMPFLQARQFVCALSYNQSNTETRLTRSAPETDTKYKYGLGYFLLDGAIALNEKIVVGTRLSFYPDQTYQQYFYPDYYERDHSDLNATLAPEITAAFRPQPGLEIAASYRYVKQEWDYVYPDGPEFPSNYQIGQRQTSQAFRISVTYFGSL